MTDILGDGGTPAPAPDPTPEPPKKEDEPSALDEIKSSIGELGEGIKGINDRLEAVEKPTDPEPVTAPDPEDKTPSDDDWKPNKWGDIPAKSEEIANKVFDEKEKERLAREAEATKAETRKKQDTDKFIDDQLVEIEKEKIIADVVDKNDPNDPGMMDRRELFGIASKTNAGNLVETAKQMKVMHSSGMRYDVPSGKYIKTESDMSGADAPVGSPAGRSVPTGGDKPDYDEIHNARSLGELADKHG